MQFSFKCAFAVVALGSLATLAVAAQDQKKQEWKDRAEYDLSDSINKEQNPTTKLQLLATWKEKYPASDFKVDRQLRVMKAYYALGKGKEMLAAAKDVIDLDPKNIEGLYWANLLTVSLLDGSADALSAGERYAKGLIEAIPDFFDAAKKPATIAEDAWKKQRSETETIAHRTLGWVALQRKQHDVAEKELLIVIQSDPNDAFASYWIGTAIVGQRKLEKQSSALYDFARAAYHPGAGTGAMPEATVKSLQAYVEKTYINIHGDRTGLDALIDAARKDPIPPAGFHIESKDEILAKQEEELKKTNPQLALWVKIKGELSGANAQAYFDSSLKGAAVPPPEGIEGVKKFKGWVVGTAPEKKPTSVIVGISGKEMSEVTLKFEKPLGAIPDKGLEVEFSGAPSAFDLDTKMLTFDVEPDDVSGLPKPVAPVKKAVAPVKKAAPKK